jgi:iron complex outermembrane receptor protein
MIQSWSSAGRLSLYRMMILTVLIPLSTLDGRTTTLMAQAAVPTGSIAGTVRDERGAPVGGAEVYLESAGISTATRSNGAYLLARVPVGDLTVRARLLGFRPDSASITVRADQRVSLDFTLHRDPMQLQTLIVTGTQFPRQNLKASVAVTTLSNEEIHQASPRSTTEMLRYVPGFTRVESSGGEVNENISIRGILGVEYVMFMEDGMPVFPTMQAFFMNPDNLFRFDENIERMEVVRGGASALFGSNTPGAIVNLINRTGGNQFGGTMRATGGTQGLARYDLAAGGPLGDDWRFNAGGFYRYDHGVRDPGFPGIRGGQLKANVTRRLDKGYLRASVKYLDDRNQFILPLPFANPEAPDYVPGLSNYAAMNTNEGSGIQVPTPTGDLKLPLENGLKTTATWFTIDAAYDLSSGWQLQNTLQAMHNDQEWNAIVPLNALPADEYATAPFDVGGLGFPAGTTIQLTYTNHFDAQGNPLPFNTPNGLVAPGGQWYIHKPISAIQDQVQLRRTFGRHALALGAYFANYTEDNHWFFTDILTDVRDIPRFLDAVVTIPGESPLPITRNGFRNYMLGYVNGSGQTSIFSGVVGGEVQLSKRLRASLGGRVEYNNFVQSAENTAQFDLDGDPATTFDNEQFGNNSFRHFSRGITDWAGSLGLNLALRDNLALYAAGSRGYRMPALDDFLNAQAEEQVDLFDAQQVQSVESGVKGQVGGLAFTVNGFYTKLKNVVGQGVIVDTVTGGIRWIIERAPETQSYGVELEAVAFPVKGLQLFGNATILEAEFGTGTDIGRRITGVPRTIGNLAGIYSVRGVELKGDFHWVASRFVDLDVGTTLPAYNYFNFGAGYTLPGGGTRIEVDLLNAFQDKGLEEGNPRLTSAGGAPIFLARPILPRRLTLSVTYDFGGPPTSRP